MRSLIPTGANIFAGSFSLCEKVSLKSFYFFAFDKIRFARKNLLNGKPTLKALIQPEYLARIVFWLAFVVAIF